MRHQDYGEPVPFQFLPLLRTGGHNVGTWWRTRDGHFLLEPYAAGWRLRGRDNPEQLWLIETDLDTVTHDSVTAALQLLSAELARVPPPAWKTYPAPLRFRRVDNRSDRWSRTWHSECGHWEATWRGCKLGVCLHARTELARQRVIDAYDGDILLSHPTLTNAATDAARLMSGH